MKLKKKWIIFFILLFIFIVIAIGAVVFYNYQLSCVDKNDKKDIIFTVNTGDSAKVIGKNLEKAKLIHNGDFFLIYVKLRKINNLQASTYKLNKSMKLNKIIDIISKGQGFNPNEITITFQEGKNIRSIAKVISENTDNKYDDVIKKVSDSKYIDSLIEKYWFIEKDVKKSGIYYPLEGYLFPDTYIFKDKNVTIEEIFAKMLDTTSIVLNKYKDKIEKSDLTIQQILTLASMVELEGLHDKDKVASVFYNRLTIGMSLGSDVTTCYALKMDDLADCHKNANFNYQSPYNTRLLTNIGIPIGPVCNPSEDSINAVLNPADTEYIYFISDKNTKLYFFSNKQDFELKILELKNNGEWLT